MEEELVSFQVAKLAKKSGFDLITNYFFYEDGVLDQGDGDTEHISLNHNKYDRYYSAPTQYLLQKWLREIHDVHIITKPYIQPFGTKEITGYYTPDIYYGKKGLMELDDNYATYEEALEHGLKIILKTIVNE